MPNSGDAITPLQGPWGRSGSSRDGARQAGVSVTVAKHSNVCANTRAHMRSFKPRVPFSMHGHFHQLCGLDCLGEPSRSSSNSPYSTNETIHSEPSGYCEIVNMLEARCIISCDVIVSLLLWCSILTIHAGSMGGSLW